MGARFLFILLVAIYLITPTIADGCAITPPYHEHVYLPSQKAAIFWDGTTEEMILSTRIATDNLTNLAWVIPLSSKVKPEIEKGDIQIFYDLAELFKPRKRERRGFFGPLGTEAQAEVQVIEEKKVDIYDITILKATNASTLVNWLNEHGYVVPETSVTVLQDYCDRENFYFIANKIDLENKYKNLTITEADRECASNLRMPPHYTSSEELNYYLKHTIHYREECKNVSLQVVKVLVELEKGITTPLKFTFQPEKPFYPLKISSINDGETNISVYVFSEMPVKDEKKVLSTHNMVKLKGHQRDKYNLTNERYVTLLKYGGNLKSLNEDSFFIPTKYEPTLDPDYVPLSERVLGLLVVILPILIFVVPILLLIVVLPFVVGHFIKKISERIKNRNFYYLPLIFSVLGSIALSIKIPWFLPIICASLINGFYAAYKNSRKWIWITVLLVLLISVPIEFLIFG